MKRKLSQDAWVLIVLVALIAILGYFLGSRENTDSGFNPLPKRTTYSSRPGGMKALYETLRQTGYPVTRSLRSLTIPPSDGILFVVSPETPVTRAESSAIREWVAKGNILVYAPSIPEPAELDPNMRMATDVSTPSAPSFLAPGVSSFCTPMNSSIDDKSWDWNSSFGWDGSLTNLPVPIKKKAVKKIGSPLISLFRTSAGDTTVAYAPWGRGGVAYLASSWPIANRGIAKGDNLVLVLNALRHRDPSRRLEITFDEYHHGYGETEGITSLIGRPAKLGLAQVLFAFILLVFAASRRFGRPIPLQEGGRQRSEYLASMASLLRRARATRAVKVELERRFLEDVCQAMGLPPTAEPDLVLRAARRRRPDKADELRRLISMPSASPDEAFDELSLLALEAQRHKMRKELRKIK